MTDHLEAPDQIPLANFRDLGQSTLDNADKKSYIKIGRMTRSATLDNMTEDEVDHFIQQTGTRTILDLRTSIEGIPGSPIALHFPTTELKDQPLNVSTAPEEKQLLPRQKFCVNFVGNNFRHHFVFPACSFLTKIKLILLLIFRQEQWATFLVSKEVLEPLGLANLYKKFLEFCPKEIHQALTIFTEERNYPIHVQCSFGKDRTGLVCFLVLAICGVPDELIVQDYAKTQAGLRPIYSELMMDLERVGLSEDFIDASPKNMRGLIDFIKTNYGSVEDYLVKVVGFGLDQQALIRKHLCVV